MASSDPGWDVPAKLDGFPYTNWKRRTGYTETGTLAQMVERWLGLAWHIQAGCSLSWGPDAAGKHGAMSADGIGAFVLRVGLPPAMLKKRSRPPTREEIERYPAAIVAPGHGMPALTSQALDEVGIYEFDIDACAIFTQT